MDGLRRRWLRGLFVLALAWTALGTAFLLPAGWSEGPHVGAEGGVFHRFMEDAFVPLAALVASGIVARVLFGVLPRFLEVPEAVSGGRMVVYLLVAAPVVSVALLLGSIVLGWVIDPPHASPENPQYIPLVFFSAIFGPAWLTPIAAVIAAWVWTRRGEGRPERD